MEKFNNTELENIFSQKFTENGDISWTTTGNRLLDILFMSEYFTKNLHEVQIGDSDIEKLFSMFIRDPRLGLGRRDLGRKLMNISGCSIEQIVKAGRVDDLFHTKDEMKFEVLDWMKNEIVNGNELVKKWMPRYSSKQLMLARMIAKYYGMNKQQYGHFVKCNTVENTMSRKKFKDVNYEHVPSLAAVKYAKAFMRNDGERYQQYLNDVKAGTKKLHVSTTNVYDIYRNRQSIDADLFYSKIEKININCLPIIDVSGSMYSEDAIGKALSIGKYLSDCSSYCKGQFVTFSQRPQLVKQLNSTYNNVIDMIAKADWGDNTDLGAVMRLLERLQNQFPEYLIILSDMEFDYGSNQSKESLMEDWRARGINTKIVWWNFNGRSKTCPEQDKDGNIFMSGYSPMLLKFLETSFDSQAFLRKLLEEYAKCIAL